MASLYIIRHGEPEITGVLLGRLDPPLSANGYKTMANSLSHLDVAIAYTSPLRRARETTHFIKCKHVVELLNLQEVDFGAWTGKTWQEIESEDRALARQKSSDWLGIDAPAAEPWSALLTRLQPVYQTIMAGEKPAAVVAHQGVNAALTYLIDGRNPLTFSQRYGEIIELEVA